ncbi:MAG: TRAM domain-containing protein, partial [Geminicoccaceae bacterium]
RRTVGSRLAILLERPGRHAGQLVGKSPYLQAVHIEAAGAAIGDLIDVDIVKHHAHSLGGEPAAARQNEVEAADPSPANFSLQERLA